MRVMTTVTAHVPGFRVIEREHSIPLDHDDPDGQRITVFTREVAAPGGEDRPYLVFLQGGPGFEATRPFSRPAVPWVERALRDYRVLLLDQRGTGRSTPVGEIPGANPAEQAAYLMHFRADAIVRDCEWIREELGVDRWSLLGQSFGGFTSMAYLSFAPVGLREVFITGGLAPIGRSVDDIYAATYRRLEEKHRQYFARYPGDAERVRDIRRRLEDGDVRLASGDRLTARRFNQMGMWLGASDGFERLHYVVELPFGSRAFLHDVDAAVGYERNPIYATLHESSYADGVATRWSAHRVAPDAVVAGERFTAEHIFPWMFEDYGALRSHAAAADILAEHVWPRMFDPAQLAVNEVPVSATIYANDLYVERDFALETAEAIRGLRPWMTDEYEHNGLRADGGRILDRLIGLARGSV